MKKNLFIILGIFLIIVAILAGIYFNTLKFTIMAQKNNKEYEQYTKNSILGSDLMTLINKASNQNDKNGIEKDEKKYYIENDTNSIKIEVTPSEYRIYTYNSDKLKYVCDFCSIK